MVRNLPTNTGEVKDAGSMPGLGRTPGGGHGNPLQYFCLENPMEREAWWATVYGITKSQTGLSMHAHKLNQVLISLSPVKDAETGSHR